ncbi:MAG: hypothetical protein J0M08_00990 [Bacteroidetes bacterium]|nr:hypothetical protein [Bacteroidota bacterium]
MKTITILSTKLLLASLILIAITNFGCKKKDTTCTANVYVVDASGAPVDGASVRLWANTSNNPSNNTKIEETQTTDSDGLVVFEFKLQAIFNADATKGALKGSAIVKLEPGETVDKTITVQ